MRFIQQLLSCLSLLLIVLILLSSCIKPLHQVTFLENSCIRPYHRYHYHTCSVLRAKVDDKYIFEVPKNFDTDLASIPRWFWSILSPQYSAFVYPAILHDYLYHCPGNLPRSFADDVFFSALITEGVSQFTASKMYMAVRLFGLHSYRKDNYCLDNYAFSDQKFIYGYS